MASGLWIAASGAAAQAQNMDIIANQLANTETPAFKKSIPTFKEYLGALERENSLAQIMPGPLKDRDLYPIQGRDQSYVVMDGTPIDFQQGAFRVTQAPLDLALEGPGFLEVKTPQGIRYTRLGQLKLNEQGQLVTQAGDPVLTQRVPDSENPMVNPALAEAMRVLQIPTQVGPLRIQPSGEVSLGEESLGTLSIVEFHDLNRLIPRGGLLFENLDPKNLKNPDLQPLQTVIHQGLLETSNVNPMEAMMQMMKAHRIFEHEMKALKTYGEIMAKEASEVGKL